MVHWVFILVGFAFGFFFGATALLWIIKNKQREMAMDTKFQAIWFADIMLGAAVALCLAIMFFQMIQGIHIYEPNRTCAISELGLCIILVCWFLWQIPFWISRVRNNK